MACYSWPGRERERAGYFGRAHNTNTHVDDDTHIREERRTHVCCKEIVMDSVASSLLLPCALLFE